jgi:hypothetical protein
MRISKAGGKGKGFVCNGSRNATGKRAEYGLFGIARGFPQKVQW